MSLPRIRLQNNHLLAFIPLLVLAASPALAQIGSDDQKCINELNKNFQKVAKTQGKAVCSCIKDGSKGKLGVQTIEECLTADNKGKVGKAKDKTLTKVGSKCVAPPPFGPNDPNTANAVAMDKELDLIHDIFGSDLDGTILDFSADKSGAKCQSDVAKQAKKCQDAKLKGFNKCKKDGLKDGSITDASGLEACVGADPKGKVVKECDTKLTDKINKKCTGVAGLETAFPGCGTGDLGELKTCIDEFVECRVCLALDLVDNINRDCDVFDDGLANGSCVFVCGDGEVEPGESCDDGNLLDDDGCSSSCAVEAGFDCAGEPSACDGICGDSLIRGSEECDDGNTANGDGCSDSCALEVGWVCDGAEPTTCFNTCGDGTLDALEECDDSGTTNGDGCSANCVQETGWVCDGAEPTTCFNTCGDGTLDALEGCDDNNLTDGDGCSDNCQIEDGYACIGAPSVCDPICGDGLVRGDEECDDGGTANGDGCSDICEIEPGQSCTGEPSVCAPLAAARLITDPNDLIGGPLARGRLGDYYMENEQIRVIVQKPQRNAAAITGQFGGQIIDADLRRNPEPGNDLFEEWSVMLNIENTAHYTSVIVLNDGSDGNPAILRATGVDDLLDFLNPSTQIDAFGFTLPSFVDDRDLPLEITTDYILDAFSPYVRMETSITNVSGSETLEIFLGDFLSSLAQEIFQPGYGFGQPLVMTVGACIFPELPCDFTAWSGEGEIGGVSYGYINTTPGTTGFNVAGLGVSVLGESAILALIGLASPNFEFAPEETVLITRFLAVGDGDVASILDIRNEIKGLATGTVKGQVTESGSPVAGAEVAVVGPGAKGVGATVNVVSQFRTDPNGRYEGTLPAEDYELRAHKEGHLFGSPNPANISLSEGQTITQDFTLPEPGTLRVTIEDPNGDPIAGKVSIVGFDPATDPGNTQAVLGLIENVTGLFGDVLEVGSTSDLPIPYGIAKVLFVDDSGDSGEFAFEPGDYQIVVSHGMEFSIHSEDVSITSGGSTLVSAMVARVVDTQGFISGDLHVHSYDSYDSRITRRQRIVSMLATGVDFFTPSEHGFRVDFTQDVSDLGVADLISTAINEEITTPDYGHFNGFPLTIDPNQVNGGAVDWAREAPAGQDFPSFGNYGLAPGEIFAEVLSNPGENTVQLNHSYDFFDGGLHFDTGLVPPESLGDPNLVRLDPSIPNFWDPSFTAIELWIEANPEQVDNFLGQTAGNWFNLLNQGIVRTGISDSDTHELITAQSGYPRNFIASPTDDAGALAAIAETLATNLNDGRLIGTNGPFLSVTLEGDPNEAGGLELGMDLVVRATGGSATVTVEIQSPTWAEFDSVEFYVNSETIADPNDRDGLPPLYRICPDFVQTDPNDFSITTVPVNGAERLEATATLALSGLTEDAWVVVMVKGTENVSCPLFPVISVDLSESANPTLADLKSCDTGDKGVNALAFSNPVFIDFDGNGDYDPPGVQFQGSCP